MTWFSQFLQILVSYPMNAKSDSRKEASILNLTIQNWACMKVRHILISLYCIALSWIAESGNAAISRASKQVSKSPFIQRWLWGCLLDALYWFSDKKIVKNLGLVMGIIYNFPILNKRGDHTVFGGFGQFFQNINFFLSRYWWIALLIFKGVEIRIFWPSRLFFIEVASFTKLWITAISK